MGRITLYRADVDSPRLARILGTVPGIAVDGETGEAAATDDTAPPSAAEESDDDGLREKIPVPDTDIVDDETPSVVRTYGLLGLGVSLVLLGISTVGIWVYLRRKSDDGGSETPPPTTGLDTEAPTGVGPSAAESTPSPSVAAPDETPGADGEPRGRTEGDRSDVEWATRDTTPSTEPETAEPETADDGPPTEPETVDDGPPTKPETVEPETADDGPPTESVDAAPLLGAAFLAASGAVVKWLQADADET